ncbi:septation regulator SpoVG [Proteinivorax tanatarense]|uniref:Putative septation protein SpoVG n=1 Tax=Proteinivorax tanatarense TaxID=1260629 RepID=A0AAU7VMH8_9FIRM
MKVTDIRIRRVNKEGKMKAIVSVTFDDEFVVHDIRVIEGTNGFFVAMPSRKGNDGEHRDIAHPIKTETRSMIQEAVLEAYRNYKEEAEV